MLNMKDRHLLKRRFYNAARLVIVMMRRGFAAKQWQKMMLRIHDFQRALINELETPTVGYDRVSFNLEDHWEEFSCSSTPVKGNEKRSWDDHLHFLLLRALPCLCPTAHEDQNEKNNCFSINDEQKQQCSRVDESPNSAMDYLDSPQMDSLCSPQVDRRAEEFITLFYEQMRLQRQDSYQQCQEMLARAT